MRTPDVARLMAGSLYGKEPWPLRFNRHGFFARRFNTQASSILYNNYQFGTRRADPFGSIIDKPSGPPEAPDWRERWGSFHGILPDDGSTFPGPVEVEWVALDGDSLSTSIDLDALFRDRLILHKVKREEVKERWLEAKSVNPVVPDILLELDDRTISIYMTALVATEAEQIPGNPNSHFRHDLVLAWTKTHG